MRLCLVSITYSTTFGLRRDRATAKKVLQRVLYEKEFQQFAARHRHLKGVDMVEQVPSICKYVVKSPSTTSKTSLKMARW